MRLLEGPGDAAWIYYYTGPAEELGELIPSGDWVAYTATRTEADA